MGVPTPQCLKTQPSIRRGVAPCARGEVPSPSSVAAASWLCQLSPRTPAGVPSCARRETHFIWASLPSIREDTLERTRVRLESSRASTRKSYAVPDIPKAKNRRSQSAGAVAELARPQSWHGAGPGRAARELQEQHAKSAATRHAEPTLHKVQVYTLYRHSGRRAAPTPAT